MFLVREVTRFQDCYKNKFYYNLPPNTIALFCTAVQRLDLFLLLSLFVFIISSPVELFLRLVDLQFAERYQSVPPPEVTGSKKQNIRPFFIDLRKKPTRGVTLAEIYHFPF